MSVGYVGLGAMGGALAGRLLAGNPLQIWDLNPQAMAALQDRGATAAASLSEMARRCDVVVLCLPRSANVEQAIFGAGGLAEGLSPGRLVIDQTSGVPSETARFAEALAARGVAMIDAPVAGGVPSALAGAITIMMSGPDAACERARPVLAAMSPRIYRASDRVGDGQAVKIVNNMVNACYRIATLELVALGRRLGLSLASVVEALNAGPGGNYATRRLLPAMVEARSSTDFSLALMVKDVNQAIALGMNLAAPMPLSSLARGLLQASLNVRGKDARLDDVAPYMETLTGVRYHDSAPNAPATAAGRIEPGRATELVAGALAACNRLIACENFVMGAKFGIEIEALGTIVNNGSGWSGEAERVVIEARGRTRAAETLAEVVDRLREVERLGATLGLPLLLTGAARAIYEARMNEVGGDTTLDDMIAHFERAAGVAPAAG